MQEFRLDANGKSEYLKAYEKRQVAKKLVLTSLFARARLGTKKIGFAKSAALILYETQALLFVMLNKAESVRKAVANRA